MVLIISDTKGSGNGQRLIITGHKSIGSIRSNSEGTHEKVYKVVSGNFKDISHIISDQKNIKK